MKKNLLLNKCKRHIYNDPLMHDHFSHARQVFVPNINCKYLFTLTIFGCDWNVIGLKSLCFKACSLRTKITFLNIPYNKIYLIYPISIEKHLIFFFWEYDKFPSRYYLWILRGYISFWMFTGLSNHTPESEKTHPL